MDKTVTETTEARQRDGHRVAYIDGLRRIADLLERHPEMPLPYDGDRAELSWMELHDDAPQRVRAWIDTIPGTVTGYRRGNHLDLRGRLGVVEVLMQALVDDLDTARLAVYWAADCAAGCGSTVVPRDVYGGYCSNDCRDTDDEDAPECEGHESLRGDLMGQSFFCDGSCRVGGAR